MRAKAHALADDDPEDEDFLEKRNVTSYDSAGNVSKQELQLAIKTAAELHRQVVAWLQKNHPELLKG